MKRSADFQNDVIVPTTTKRHLQCTVIGSFPKPCYCKQAAPDWFEKRAAGTYAGDAGETTAKANTAREMDPQEREQLILQATDEILSKQSKVGIDFPTDGEVRRENYIHHLCRSIEGISFDELTRQKCRPRIDDATGETVYAFEASLPTVVERVRWAASEKAPTDLVVDEWRLAQARTEKELKFTLPGPMTIIGTVANRHYCEANGLSEEQLARDLGILVKDCVDALVKAGCTQIQVDEPLFARKPKEALSYGIDILDEIVGDVPKSVFTTCHICCGYPNYLDQKDYVKANQDVYIQLAPRLAESKIDGYSLEDAHRPNDFARLLPLMGKKTVVLGCLKIASSQLDTVEEIEARLTEALKHIPSEQLVVAPDCGLAFLTEELAMAKLENMVEAAKRVSEKLC